MNSEDFAQVAVCGSCGVRLTILGPPATLGGSAVFTARCVQCKARVPLASPLAGIREVRVASDEPS